MFYLFVLIGIIITKRCSGGNVEIHAIPVSTSRAIQYCSLTNKRLALSNNPEAITLCQNSDTKECIVADKDDQNKVVILDAANSQIKIPTEKCHKPIICESKVKISGADADDIQTYTDDMYNKHNYNNEYNNEYNGNNGYDDNQYYGFDPELVCMQYQYYVAISTLIMICFATFICMTIVILNKIKDHQTLVHVRI
eukprot:426370_1